MAAPGLTIPTTFTANGNYPAQVNRMSNATDRMLGSLSRLNAIGKGAGLSDTTKKVLSYAKSALLVGGAFATASFSADAIMDYETAIQSLQAVTGASGSQMVGFKKQISELGDTSKKSMIDVAKSFETVGSMMSQYLDDPKALRMITEAGITLSKASRMELEPALQSLTSVMNQFQIGAEGANKTIQTLTAGEIVGAVRTSDASQYLQEFGAVAKNMGVNVGESIALIEALGMQLKQDKIGVGARNILTSIGAAGGLDKKARSDMKAAGVDMKFLMNSSNSLSSRLHELSKIAKDPIKMISVFGKENVTAASVIFNQLGTYDKFYNKIQTTAEAENQAAVNSKTFAVALEQLKNKWSNLLNSSSEVAGVLDKFRTALFYVADHMEDIISIGGKLVTGFLIWKGAIMATQIALVSYRAITQALFLVDMVKYVAVTKGITTATAAYEIVMASLNATMLLNPALLVVAGLTALIGGLYFANQRVEELTAAYLKQRDLNLVANYNAQTDALEKQVRVWKDLGYSIHDATIQSLKFDTLKVNKDVADAEINVKSKEDQLFKATDEAWFPAFNNNVLKLREESEDAKMKKTEALYRQRGNTDNVIRSVNTGVITNEEGRGMFRSPETADKVTIKKHADTIEETNKKLDDKSLQAIEAAKEMLKGIGQNTNTSETQKLEVIINNQSGGSIDVKSGQTQAKSVMPNTKSTFQH